MGSRSYLAVAHQFFNWPPSRTHQSGNRATRSACFMMRSLGILRTCQANAVFSVWQSWRQIQFCSSGGDSAGASNPQDFSYKVVVKDFQIMEMKCLQLKARYDHAQNLRAITFLISRDSKKEEFTGLILKYDFFFRFSYGMSRFI